MGELRFAIALMLLALAVPQGAAAQAAETAKEAPPVPREPICRVIESVARAKALPIEFFTQVI
jgi:hypothetical protein